MGSNAARRVQWMSCSTNGAGPPRDNLLSALIAAEEAGQLLTDAALQARAACRRRSQAPLPATGSPNGYMMTVGASRPSPVMMN